VATPSRSAATTPAHLSTSAATASLSIGVDHLHIPDERTTAHRQIRSTCLADSSDSRLLETSLRAGVWPDSVQVLGGTLASRLPARSRVWLYSGLRTAGHRGAVWLKRGVPGSQ
jgi:hypothetical protein